MWTAIRVTLSAFVAATLAGSLAAQAPAAGRIEHVVVRGASLDGNRLGIPVDRAVSVYLPPSYDRSNRRFPVLYVLHGIMDTNGSWTEGWDTAHPGFATIQDLMNRGIGAGALAEMIVVMPDAEKTCHYTDSPVKGGWGSFVARDLVQFVDERYRTMATPERRGVMGHSMGGHGAIKLAMTHPGTFTAVYAMNPSLLGFGGDVSAQNPELAAAVAIRAPADLSRASFYAQAVVGVSQCFSPDPSAPLLAALPFVTDVNGGLRNGPAYERWRAQMPLYMLASHAETLKRLRGLAFDSARTDEFSHIPETSAAFSRALTEAGVPHRFEMYDGDHRNRLWGSQGRLYTSVLPFFSRLLGGVTASAVAATAPSEAPGTPAPRPNAAQLKLWDAAIAGDTKAATDAINAGADVHGLDVRNSANGRRPLNYAAENDRAELIKLLVARGADINRPNNSGFTPLHHAAESGSLAAAEALVALGANRNARLPSGSTPLDIARQRGRAAIVRLLERNRPANAGLLHSLCP